MLSHCCLHHGQGWERETAHPDWQIYGRGIRKLANQTKEVHIFPHSAPNIRLKSGLISGSCRPASPPLSPEMCRGRYIPLWSPRACRIKRLLRLLHFAEGIISKFYNPISGNPEMISPPQSQLLLYIRKFPTSRTVSLVKYVSFLASFFF